MNYRQAEDYLNTFTNYEQIPGITYAPSDYTLRHVEELLARMGNPQSAARTIHIAGTNFAGIIGASFIASGFMGEKTAKQRSKVHPGVKLHVRLGS